ncbi:hypothetical protein CTEN210_10917 [Chaetoceros tenuissimus]|uniref:Fe2OG dioxygenase domain-containing protein n=1 Tax=Chaetoceros tenuissimus TaxID=426638 RepID=A0AAD3D0B9_9STRA|nr:hypothetical protein CTEN210_10917 [Chaetoceros tenuissimus]
MGSSSSSSMRSLSLSSFEIATNDEVQLSHSMETVIEENKRKHEEMVEQSENLFYGFYGPNGFDKFDEDNTPSDWQSFSLSSEQNPEIEIQSEDIVLDSIDIWDTLIGLDKRIVPAPFTADDLARVSCSPILSPDECQEIIEECDNHYFGWGTSGSRYGTPAERIGNIIKLEDLSRTYSLVNFELLPRLFPAIANAFPSLGASPTNLRLAGSRIVKYDASEGRVELGLHRDGKLITANIALNDMNDYEGGGTYIEGLNNFMDNPIKLEKGHVLLHPGDVRHGGAPITKGQRYVLVCFIIDKTIIPHEKYCHDRVNIDIEARRAIPSNDDSRTAVEEREVLLASAAKHCADALRFANGNFDQTSPLDF